MPPMNNQPTEPNTPVPPVIPPQEPAMNPVSPPPTETTPPVIEQPTTSTNNMFNQQPQTTQAIPQQPMTAPKTGFKLNKKMAIIGGAIVVVVVLTIGAFTFLKTPLAQVASNIGINSINLKEYTNDKMKFSLQVPEGWETKVTDTSYDSSGLGYVYMDEPVGDLNDKSDASTHYGHIRISVNDSSKLSYAQKDEAKYFSDIKKNIQATTANKSTEAGQPTYEIDSDSTTTVNGLSAYKVKLKVNNYDYEAGANGYQYLLAVYVDKTLSYKVELQAHASETDILAKADSILESFKKL